MDTTTVAGTTVSGTTVSETTVTTPLAASPGGRRRHRLAQRVVALVLPVLVLAGLAVGGAAPASAATWTNVGSNGVAYTYPTAVAQNVTKAQYGLVTTYSGVKVPGMLLGRSPATAGAQSVSYNVAVEQFNPTTQSWVQLRTAGTGSSRFQLTSERVWAPTYEMQVGMQGYYRVSVGINWFDAYGRWIGGRLYALNAAGDYSCAITGCQVGQGWIWLAR